MKLRHLSMLIVAVFVVVGCSKQADTNKSVDQIKTEVESMSIKDLESTAKAYAEKIQSKEGEVDKVKAQLKGLSPKDILSEKGKSIKDDVSTITKEVSELTKRYKIYADKYAKMGGDIAAIKVA